MRSMRRVLRGQALLLTGGLVVGGLVALAPSSAVAASAGDVVINELMYNPGSDLDGDEFLELMNTTSSPVDMSGWTFSGVTATLPSGTTIPAHGFFVMSPDATRFAATYGGAPNAIYTGKLSNGGETISVKDAGAVVIDSVTYSDTAGWPVTPDGVGPSLELIDPAQDHNDPLNWAASTAVKQNTVGAPNSVAHTGLSPRITNVVATPAQPAPGQAVVVTATVTGLTGTPNLRYLADFGNIVTVQMSSTGSDGFTATIPGVAAGHLIRYRIQATNSVGTTWFPRIDDTILYQGVVATSSVTSAIPILEWFIPDADYNEMVNNPTADITKKGVLAYNGLVIDNIETNIRGNASQKAPKVGWTFHLPQSHDLFIPGLTADPVDSFAMEANWGDKSHGRQYLAWQGYAEAGVAKNEVFPVHTQRNAQYQGFYIWVGLLDGTWRGREGYDNSGFYKAETHAFSNSVAVSKRYTKENPKDNDYTALTAFLNGLNLTGPALRNFMLENANIPEMIDYAAASAIVQHVDQSTHNFYLTQDLTTGRWGIIPWDLDHTFGFTCCNVTSKFVTPAEPGDQTNKLMQVLLSQPDWNAMYFRRLRTLVDQILAPGHLEALYDAKFGPGKPDANADLALWPTKPFWNYDNQRTKLFSALNTRRQAFATDARVPAAQSANPNVVVNEIQHSPVAGGNAEFFELYNPSTTEAVDLSNWSISDAVTLTIRPGTVILPQGFMVFAANDVTFRATYGSTLFLAGTYSGGLSSAETITLKRADASVDDVVTYGGAGWPVATGGPSLELIDPTSDNNVGSNWMLSSGQGTPGAANS
jgi:hypothetical protein